MSTDARAGGTTRPHGYARYRLDRCRCEICRQAVRDYNARRAADPTPPFIPAGPVREHIAELRREGLGLRQIAQVSGVSLSSLQKLVTKTERVRRRTAEALLAVSVADRADNTRVDAAATWALIDDLVDAGVPKRAVAAWIGQKGPLQLSHQAVSARHARRVREMWETWHDGRLEWRGVRWEAASSSEARSAAAMERWEQYQQLCGELAAVLEERMAGADWRSQAACRGREVSVFFPDDGDDDSLKAARAICGACGVRDQCRLAGDGETWGVWGAVVRSGRLAA